MLNKYVMRGFSKLEVCRRVQGWFVCRKNCASEFPIITFVCIFKRESAVIYVYGAVLLSIRVQVLYIFFFIHCDIRRSYPKTLKFSKRTVFGNSEPYHTKRGVLRCRLFFVFFLYLKRLQRVLYKRFFKYSADSTPYGFVTFK